MDRLAGRSIRLAPASPIPTRQQKRRSPSRCIQFHQQIQHVDHRNTYPQEEISASEINTQLTSQYPHVKYGHLTRTQLSGIKHRSIMTSCVSNPVDLARDLPNGLGQNGGRVDLSQVGLLRATPAELSMGEMRERLREDGYLFVKGLISREDVLDARENYFKAYTNTSLLAPGSSPRDGIFNMSDDPDLHKGIGGQGLPVDPEEERILIDSHSDPKYRAFVEHPALTGFVRELMDWKEHQLLDRTMLRHNVPFGLGTGIHYDKLFLRGGDGFFLTAWVPIGDIAINGGGLCYLTHSVPLGKTIEDDYTTRSATFTPAQKISAYNPNMLGGGMVSSSPQQFAATHAPSGYKWLVTEYEAGDVVFHHPYAIHASGRNEDESGRIRLSTDLRFYEKGDGGVDERWLRIWNPGDGL